MDTTICISYLFRRTLLTSQWSRRLGIHQPAAR
jgi:hypothetical protein